MSYYVVRCMVPGYEDYERMINGSNAYSGWPALWEPERYAEGALYEEYKAMLEQVAVMRRFRALHPQPAEESNSVVKALVSIARENGWKVKSEDTERILGHQVYTIPPLPDDDHAPYNWNDYVRWLDRQKTREEQADAETKQMKEEREAKRQRDNRIIIDYAALVELMEDMMPNADVVAMRKKPRPYRVPKADAIIQALVMLADESGWQHTDPHGYQGPCPPPTFRIR